MPVERRVVTFGKGLSNFLPESLPDGYGCLCKDADLEGGTLKARPDIVRIRERSDSSAPRSLKVKAPILGMTSVESASGRILLAVESFLGSSKSGTATSKIRIIKDVEFEGEGSNAWPSVLSLDAEYVRIEGGVSAVIGQGVSPVEFVARGSKIYALGFGHGWTCYVIDTSTFAATLIEGEVGIHGCLYHDFMATGNVRSAGKPLRLWFSAALRGLSCFSFDEDDGASYYDIPAGAGEEITGVQFANNRVIVVCSRSTWAAAGTPGESMVFERILDVGSSDPRTIALTEMPAAGGMVAMLASDGLVKGLSGKQHDVVNVGAYDNTRRSPIAKTTEKYHRARFAPVGASFDWRDHEFGTCYKTGVDSVYGDGLKLTVCNQSMLTEQYDGFGYYRDPTFGAEQEFLPPATSPFYGGMIPFRAGFWLKRRVAGKIRVYFLDKASVYGGVELCGKDIEVAAGEGWCLADMEVPAPVLYTGRDPADAWMVVGFRVLEGDIVNIGVSGRRMDGQAGSLWFGDNNQGEYTSGYHVEMVGFAGDESSPLSEDGLSWFGHGVIYSRNVDADSAVVFDKLIVEGEAPGYTTMAVYAWGSGGWYYLGAGPGTFEFTDWAEDDEGHSVTAWWITLETQMPWVSPVVKSVSITTRAVSGPLDELPFAVTFAGKYCLCLKRNSLDENHDFPFRDVGITWPARTINRDMLVWNGVGWTVWEQVGAVLGTVMRDHLGRERFIFVDEVRDADGMSEILMFAESGERNQPFRPPWLRFVGGSLFLNGGRAGRVQRVTAMARTQEDVLDTTLQLHVFVDGSQRWLAFVRSLARSHELQPFVGRIAQNAGRYAVISIGHRLTSDGPATTPPQRPIEVVQVALDVQGMGPRDGAYPAGGGGFVVPPVGSQGNGS